MRQVSSITWIPVAERLPDTGIDVLVTYDRGFGGGIKVDTAFYSDGLVEWYVAGAVPLQAEYVLAWAEKPEGFTGVHDLNAEAVIPGVSCSAKATCAPLESVLSPKGKGLRYRTGIDAETMSFVFMGVSYHRSAADEDGLFINWCPFCGGRPGQLRLVATRSTATPKHSPVQPQSQRDFK